MTEALEKAVAGLIVAMALSAAVRGATAMTNQTIGRAWPFVLARCHAAATPGCETMADHPRFQALNASNGQEAW